MRKVKYSNDAHDRPPESGFERMNNNRIADANLNSHFKFVYSIEGYSRKKYGHHNIASSIVCCSFIRAVRFKDNNVDIRYTVQHHENIGQRCKSRAQRPMFSLLAISISKVSLVLTSWSSSSSQQRAIKKDGSREMSLLRPSLRKSVYGIQFGKKRGEEDLTWRDATEARRISRRRTHRRI